MSSMIASHYTCYVPLAVSPYACEYLLMGICYSIYIWVFVIVLTLNVFQFLYSIYSHFWLWFMGVKVDTFCMS